MSKDSSIQTLEARATELDRIAGEAALAFGSKTAGVSQALQLAEGIEKMRALLDTPEIKTRIVALQDTRLGFRTDRDPKMRNRKTGQNNEPYPWPVVRECALEALLRGVTLCGNQWNIIANNTYITKEGYQWRLQKLPGFADFKPVIGIPVTAAGGAKVHCEATWTLKGQPGNLSCDIAAKGDDYTGVDGYVGKAERKFYKRVYEIVSGNVGELDGDVDDTKVLMPPPAEPKRVELPTFNGKKSEPVDEDDIPMTDTPAEAPPEPKPKRGRPPKAAEDSPQQLTKQEQLADEMQKSGFSFDDMVDYCKDHPVRYPGADSWPSFSEMPIEAADYMLTPSILIAAKQAMHARKGKA